MDSRRPRPAPPLRAPRRGFSAGMLASAAALAGLGRAPRAARAAWPDKPIRIIGFPAGGPLAGHAQFMAESIPQVSQSVKRVKVRALGVTSRQRNPALPDTPTLIEAGLKDFELVGFYGFLAPAGTPRQVVQKLSQAFTQVLD